MKAKDIITLIIGIVMIIGAGFYLVSTFFPDISFNQTKGQPSEISMPGNDGFSGEIDTKTLQQVEGLDNYGESNLDNIGRPNPFANLD